MFFLHFVNRSGIPLTSFPNLECFFPAFTTAYEFRIWATRCLNWATVITVPALRPATSRLGDAGGDCRAPGGTGPEKLRLPPPAEVVEKESQGNFRHGRIDGLLEKLFAERDGERRRWLPAPWEAEAQKPPTPPLPKWCERKTENVSLNNSDEAIRKLLGGTQTLILNRPTRWNWKLTVTYTIKLYVMLP